MQDVLYIGDIPDSFCYAVFSNGYVTLYDQPSATNTTLPYYRIYFNDNSFNYSEGMQSFGQYNTTVFQKVEVSNKFYYRRDFDSILICTFIISIFFLFITNIITSFIKKGGVLGGLF